MARTASELSASEIVTVEELDAIANNSVIYKDNSWTYSAVPLWANGTVLTSTGATSAPSFSAWGWSGDVVGPASATDNAIVRFDGTTGKLVQNSSVTVDDSGNVSAASLTTTGAIELGNASDTTLSRSGAGVLAVEWVVVPTISSTNTLTNKTINLSSNTLTGTIAEFNAACSDADFATGGGTVTGTSSGTNTGDQNLFSTIAVSGQSNVVADSTSDTLTLVAGTNVTITTDASTDSVTINSTASGLTWGSSINGATGTGLALSMDNSYAASGIGQSITIGNTQTQALTALRVDTWSSNVEHVGIKVNALRGYITNNGGWVLVNWYSSATQAVWVVAWTLIGKNFNTNSANSSVGLYIQNENNTWGGTNRGIAIINNATNNAAVDITQVGSGGTIFNLTTSGNTTNSSWVVSLVHNNTQSWASVMQKIDLWTSAQWHTGLLINSFGASTTQIGVKIDRSTTGTGIGLNILGSAAGNADAIQIGSSALTDAIRIGLDLTRNWFTLAQFRNTVSSASHSNNSSDRFIVKDEVTNTATSGTLTNNYNTAYILRKPTQNWAGGTFVNTWTVLKVENDVVQTAGTSTDSVDLIQLTQDTLSTGNPISITQNAVTSTNFRRLIKETATGITIWMGNGTTANGNLSGTAGDILINGGSNKPEYCTWTTNWTALV